jgi:glutathionylspermidine synthase
MFRRHVIAPRPHYAERLMELDFVLADGAQREYWHEAACWELSARDVAMFESTTATLHALCMQAAAYAVAHDLNALLGIADAFWPDVKASWHRGDPSLYGRMDLRWDGVSPPQLLEYNADTPTALYEAAVLQWDWLEQTRPRADQFNSLHETLIAHWRRLAGGADVHFTCLPDHLEDRITVEYVRDTAQQAGVHTQFISVANIGWNGKRFVDLENRAIKCAFKLYPTEWMFREQFGPYIGGAGTLWLEPPWRLMLASKGMLALLWQLNPGHPNLLAASPEKGRLGVTEIAKPMFGREGANIRAPGWETGGPFGADPYVYQAWRELPCVDGIYPVFGSWVVGGRACGLGVREDTTPITRDTSCFVPHFFMPESI